MIEQGGEYRAIPYTLQRVRGRGLQKAPHLRITKSRRAALIIIGGRPLDAVHWIAEDGIALAEVIEQRRKRRELAADARWSETPSLHFLAPGDHMRPRDGAQRAVIFQIGEGDELRDIDLVGASRFGVGDVGEPFQFRRNIGKLPELSGSQ